MVVGLVLAASAALAQETRVSLPLEVSSGFTLGAGRPTPFAGSVHAGLLARLGPERTLLAGPSAAWISDHRGDALAAGARIGIRVPGLGARDAGAFVFVEALRARDRAPLSITLLADLPVRPALFARVGATYTRDLDARESRLTLLVGVDLARWAVALFGDDGPHVVETE